MNRTCLYLPILDASSYFKLECGIYRNNLCSWKSQFERSRMASNLMKTSRDGSFFVGFHLLRSIAHLWSYAYRCWDILLSFRNPQSCKSRRLDRGTVHRRCHCALVVPHVTTYRLRASREPSSKESLSLGLVSGLLPSSQNQR